MKRTTKRIVTISSVLVAILMLLCAGVILYINSIFDRIEKIPEVSRVDPSNEFSKQIPQKKARQLLRLLSRKTSTGVKSSHSLTIS